MHITPDEQRELSRYIIAYIDEEMTRNPNADIDETMIANAIEAFVGGAR